ncbi:MAG TPA: CDP-alcohol phosphatidyltransferase family protein [Bacillota bacterium]|nr:CDP-alcohol phosphatidyltransferase family protein [Bacillota bacterium]
MIGFYNASVIATYLSLASALFGMYFAYNVQIPQAMLCLMFSGFCDMFDGKIARHITRTKQEQDFGIQLDSLADLVCFGVLPSVIGYALGLKQVYYIIILILYVICGLIRLAYFNVTEQERQNVETTVRKYYEGLPITSVALILPALFCFSKLIGGLFPIVYASALVLLAAAFIIRFKVKKPDNLMLVIMLIAGIAVTAVLAVIYL